MDVSGSLRGFPVEAVIAPALEELKVIGKLAEGGADPTVVFALYMDVYVGLHAAGRLAEVLLDQVTKVIDRKSVTDASAILTSAIDARMKELADAVFR